MATQQNNNFQREILVVVERNWIKIKDSAVSLVDRWCSITFDQRRFHATHTPARTELNQTNRSRGETNFREKFENKDLSIWIFFFKKEEKFKFWRQFHIPHIDERDDRWIWD